MSEELRVRITLRRWAVPVLLVAGPLAMLVAMVGLGGLSTRALEWLLARATRVQPL